MRKIFGIGLSRTGTTSLAHALKDLGFNIDHYPRNKKAMFEARNDGACDIPVVIYYKDLDKKFPNSKFIYTIRDKESWLASVETHFKRRKINNMGAWQRENRISVYKQLEFNKDIFSKVYDDHDKDVREYFTGREGDILTLDICGGDNLDKLTGFIGVTKSTYSKFPHMNKKKPIKK